MDRTFGAEAARDGVLLLARLLMMVLFVTAGVSKLTGFAGTVAYFVHDGVPMPALAAAIAVVMELVVGLAIVVGLWTRPLALLMAVYTLGTAILGHHFWTFTGMDRLQNTIHFFKNISIIGGLLALYVTGAGRFSIDRRLGLA